MSTRKDLRAKFAPFAPRLRAEEGRTYWQCLEELADSESFAQLARQEFSPLADVWPEALDRRKFLGLIGASLALAGVGGCSVRPAPEGTIVPYVQPPENTVPGVPLYYATTMVHAGDAIGLLVESHEGRPTKIEGNPSHPASLGATDAIHQASVLSLYDPLRSQAVMQGNRIRGWDEAETAIRGVVNRQQAQRGRGLRILTETIVSPTLAWQIEQLLAAFPEAKWHQYEPVSRWNAYQATQAAFGRPLAAVFDFRAADVVLSLDGDFLTGAPGHVRYANDFMSRRRVASSAGEAATAQMNRLYVVETEVSPTGAKADHRLAVRMTDIERIARKMAAALSGSPVEATAANAEDRWVAAVARDLTASAAQSLVLVGHRQPPAVHQLAHAMNQRLGNVGQTVRYVTPAASQPRDPVAQLRALVDDIRADEVEALFILGGDPAYTAPADIDFAAVLRKVGLAMHLGLYENATSRLCHWNLPAAHYLESWSDARALDGTASIVQPLIDPLYDGRTAHDIIALLSELNSKDARELVQNYWREQQAADMDEGQFRDFWQTALHDGVIPGTAFNPVDVDVEPAPLADLARGDDSIPSASSDSDALEIVFQSDPTIHDGRYANNAWLQELPKPITKLTWDNAAIMSPRTAERLNIAYKSFAHGGEHGGYNVPMLTLTLGDRSVQAPAWIMPGHADGSVTVYLGHGQTYASRGNGAWQPTLGFNAYALRTSDSLWFAPGLVATKTGATYPVACTQAHHVMDDRDVIRSGTLAEYHRDPRSIAERNEAQRGSISNELKPPRGTLYEPHDYSPPLRKWGMSIDTTACVGCNACVVACQAENNIPVVGKEQVLFGREMHWIRIDRYVQGELESPAEFYFQPVPCMHCEHAPCEYVCPVEATVHSAEGLNDMIYNRCVGTRFCSNNCPYKVRRFNFLAYADFDTVSLRMQYNPDVTVRSRGVMEKCSYCVQRIRRAEIDAEAAGRPLRDGEIVTACQAVCPAQAIVFGDMNDASCAVARRKASPLDYGLLEELNTYPRTTYLAALRNPNPELEGE